MEVILYTISTQQTVLCTTYYQLLTNQEQGIYKKISNRALAVLTKP